MNKLFLIITITITLLSQTLVSKSQASLMSLSAANQTFLSNYIDVNNNLTWTNSSTQRGDNVMFLDPSVLFEFLESERVLTLVSDSAPNSGLIIKTNHAVFKNVNFMGFNRSLADNSGNGAVMNISSGSLVAFDGNFSFSNGAAANSGGALFISNSIVNFSDAILVKFENNESFLGGAVYLENAAMVFSAHNTNPSIYFKNNLSRTNSNDIYSQNGTVIFDVFARRYAALTNGIRTQGSNTIIKTGAGDIIFEGESSMINGTFNIESGRAIFRSSIGYIGRATVYETAVLSLKDGGANEISAAFLALKGALELDLDFSSAAAQSDKVLAQNTAIQEGASLLINPINKKRWIYGAVNTVILSEGDISYSPLSYEDQELYKVHFIPSENAIAVMYIGEQPLNLYSLHLTHNQKEAALFIESAKRAYYHSDSESDIQNYENAYRFDAMIVRVLRGQTNTKLFLEEMSGSFLAQTIVAPAMDDLHQTLYHKVRKANIFPFLPFEEKAKENISSSLWGEVFIGNSSLDNKDGAVDGKLSNSKRGAVGGYTFIEKTFMSLGAFAAYGQENLKRRDSHADFQNFEGGLYGGLFSDFFEHRFFLNGGLHQVKTIREMDFGQKYSPIANFNLLSIKGGIESGIPLSNSKTIKPQLFLGLRGAMVFNDEIREKGEEMRANVGASSYKRASGYGGLKVEGGGWHIAAELGSVLTGNNEASQFEINIEGFERSLTVEGSNRDFAFYGLKGGLEKEIKPYVYLYALGAISRSRDGYENNLSANIGIKKFLSMDKDIKLYGDAIRRKNLQAKIDKARFEKERREELALEKRLKAEEERRRIEAMRMRKTELLDKTIDDSFNAPPNIKQEEALLDDYYGQERIAANVLINQKGKISWIIFVNAGGDAFESGSASLSAFLKEKLAKELEIMEDKSISIGRIRILRYGTQPSEPQSHLAQIRAEQIYKEMSAFFAQKETRKEARRLREAEERRKSAKASYKLKAASFESGSDILSLDAVKNIKVLAQAIKEDSYQRITVEGHTDSTGTDEINNSLSDKRAMAVYSELIRNGVDINRLQIVGFGSKMPISDNLTANGKAQNRRVEIFIE